MALKSFLVFAFVTLLFLSLSNGTHAKSHSKKSHAAAPAPAPTQDCSSYLSDMTDCLDFVTLGSNSTKPTATCCVGLKKVVTENTRCLCDALANSKDYGIELNMSRAEAMPTACGVATPSASKCKISVAPAYAPAPGPSGGRVAAVPTPVPGNAVAVTLPSSVFTVSTGVTMFLMYLLIG